MAGAFYPGNVRVAVKCQSIRRNFIRLANGIDDVFQGLMRQPKDQIMADLSPDKWLTLEEAKAFAKVKSINTIKTWIKEGYIDATKTTGQWRVDRESIDDWFKSGIS